MDTRKEEANDDGSDYVAVAEFLNPSEAQMAKGALEADGIRVFIQGENANSLVSMALGSQLLVSRKDEAAAQELLGSVGESIDPEDDLA
ncbi:MAG TPA: DUF2007 domain-containing protein [Acidobacteriaceae bacterium]